MMKTLFLILVTCAAALASADEETSSLERKLAERSVSKVQIAERVRELSPELRIRLMDCREKKEMRRMDRFQVRQEMMREIKDVNNPKPNPESRP